MDNVIDLRTRARLTEGALYLLYSDNFDGEIVTAAALKELRRQMSTGDYSCHLAVPIDIEPAILLLRERGLIERPLMLRDLID